MISPHSIDIPSPKNWQDFERLMRTLLTEHYKKHFDRVGQEGQRQNGIDIFCRYDKNGIIGVQCKGRNVNFGNHPQHSFFSMEEQNDPPKETCIICNDLLAMGDTAKSHLSRDATFENFTIGTIPVKLFEEKDHDKKAV